jgi:hypothetical protein
MSPRPSADGAEANIPILKDGDDFFFHIMIRYRGPFTTRHETSACWRWDDSTLGLIKYGGAEYNYER